MRQIENNLDAYSKIDLHWTQKDEEFLKIAIDVHDNHRNSWVSMLKKAHPEILDWI